MGFRSLSARLTARRRTSSVNLIREFVKLGKILNCEILLNLLSKIILKKLIRLIINITKLNDYT